LSEILNILDGALNSKPTKVNSYAQFLAEKLQSSGEAKAAARIRRVLKKAQENQLSPSSLSQLTHVPVDGDSRMSLADEELYGLDEVTIFLEPNTIKLVERFLAHIAAADVLVAEGVGLSPSMLVYGPPGCGKTQLGRYISARLGLPLLTARTDGLISSYLGTTAKNLRSLFEHAMCRPCVFFLDEFDAIAKLRDDQHELGELKRVVVSLLQNIDALDNETILIAATNHDHLLDPAIWRRFAYKVRIDKPGENIRERLFEYFLGDFAAIKNFRLLRDISDGLNGGAIRQVCEDSKREAILSGRRSVSLEDILPHVIGLHPDYKGIAEAPVAEQIPKYRELAPRLFTFQRLARLFGVSTSHAHNLCKRKG